MLRYILLSARVMGRSFFRSLNIPVTDPGTSSGCDEPSPDGFPLKTFADKLSPLLLKMLNESLQSGIFPPTLCQATISLTLKEDKDLLL